MDPNYLNNFIVGQFITSLYCTYAVILIANLYILYLQNAQWPSFDTNVGVVIFLTHMVLNLVFCVVQTYDFVITTK